MRSHFNWGFFNRSKILFSELLHSAPIIKGMSVLDGAVKSALGIHYIFDYGTQFFLTYYTHSNLFKGFKYTFTGLTFVMSTYHGYCKKYNALNFYEKANLLTDRLTQGVALINKTKNVFAESHHIAQAAGYGSFQSTHQLDDTPIKITSFLPPSKSLYENCNESKPTLILKSLLDGSVTAVGIYYIFTICGSFFPRIQEYHLIKNILMGMTFIGKTLMAYDQRKMEVHFKIKTTNLNTNVTYIFNKLHLLQKKLGSRDKLLSIIRQGEEINQQTIHPGISPLPLEKSVFSISPHESTSVRLIESILEAASKAASVHSILEIACPEMLILKYVISSLTLLWASYRTYLHSLADMTFHKKLIIIQTKYNEVVGLLMFANKIVLLERNLLKNILAETHPPHSNALFHPIGDHHELFYHQYAPIKTPENIMQQRHDSPSANSDISSNIFLTHDDHDTDDDHDEFFRDEEPLDHSDRETSIEMEVLPSNTTKPAISSLNPNIFFIEKKNKIDNEMNHPSNDLELEKAFIELETDILNIT